MISERGILKARQRRLWADRAPISCRGRRLAARPVNRWCSLSIPSSAPACWPHVFRRRVPGGLVQLQPRLGQTGWESGAGYPRRHRDIAGFSHTT